MFELRPLQPDVDGLCLRGGELRVGLLDVRTRDDARIVLVASQRCGTLVGLDRLIEEVQLGVERARLKVVDRKFGAEAQTSILEITSRGLRRGTSGGYTRPDPSP